MKRTLHKTSTSLAFALAAFVVTTSGAYAFKDQAFLTQAGLSDDQVIAMQEARELRKMGDVEAARDVLVEAGVDLELVHELRKQHRQQQKEQFKALIDEQLTDEQKNALQVARQANDRETARAILEEAGIEKPPHKHHKHHSQERAGRDTES